MAAPFAALRKFAKENPITAQNIGVTSALKEIAVLKAERDSLRAAMEILSTAIQRDKSRNACWLKGEAIHVHAIEGALKKSI